VTGSSATKKTVEGICSPRFRPCPVHISNAFLWSAGTITNLGTLGGDYSAGQAINNLGEVVGSAQTKSGASESFLFRDGEMTGLGSFGASAINDLGVIAGTSPIPSTIPGTTQSDAAILENGKVTDIGSLPTVNVTDGGAINNSNEVIGTGDNSESDLRAWVWRNGALTDIGTLGGPQTAAYAINNEGQIVGFSQTSTDADHGFIYQNGTMTDIGLNLFPYAINDNGEIAGSGGCGGAVVMIGGICRNLQNLIPPNSGYSLFEAKGINNKGQIIVSTGPDGGSALLLTPD
jgi:probable HAF family extracellular repeat protein